MKEDNLSFNQEIKLLESIVGFGKKIVSWEEGLPIKIEYRFPITVQLNRTLEIIKAIKVLIENNEYPTILILLRSQIESFFYLAYLLEKDTENRCLAYNYWHLLEEKKDRQRATYGTELNKQHSKAIQKNQNYNVSFSPNFGDFSEKIRETEDKLSLEIYDIVKNKLENLKQNGIKRPNWYQYFNEDNKNIKELAYNLGLHAYYESSYSHNSKSTHSNDAHASYLEAKNDENGLIVIDVVLESSNLAINLFKNYIERRQSNRVNELSSWFHDEIKELLSNIIEKT